MLADRGRRGCVPRLGRTRRGVRGCSSRVIERRDPRASPCWPRPRVDERELTRPGANAASVLSHVPGVQVSESGGSADPATASLRGATSAQTPVYLAGIRLNDDVTGSVDLSLIPVWMLGRAEIYRGNAPADSDRLGIGGAVYFEPRAPA